jgi:CheY-like chemotaxis protein
LARKILLADDSVTAQNMGRKILTDAGYDVITVNNGSAALKKIAEGKPDLIVLDVYMPGYSGLEVCQRIKENRETSRIPILLTVGKLEPFKPEEARRARADAFVVKPFEASELLAALTKLEDKIIPQPEPYKQGRFARAVASVDQESTEKFGDSDEGWKARLRIPVGPSKSRDNEPPPDYTATQGKGFRDFVEPTARKTQPKPAAANTFERPVPAGVPDDITPEEIAAITAAAAQLSGAAAAVAPVVDAVITDISTDVAHTDVPTVVEADASDATPEDAGPVTFASAPEIETPEPQPVSADFIPETVSVPEDLRSEAEPPAEMMPSAVQEQAPAETNQPAIPAETTEPIKSETLPVVDTTQLESRVDPTPSTSVETSPDLAPPDVEGKPADDEVMAALQALIPPTDTANVAALPSAGSQDNVSPAASASTSAAAGPRWVAEEIALAADEVSASLETEMQHAYTAASTEAQPAPLANPTDVPAVAAATSSVSDSATVYAMATAAAAGEAASLVAAISMPLPDGSSPVPAIDSAREVAEPVAASTPQSQLERSEVETEVPGGSEIMAANWKNIRDSIAGAAAKPAPTKEEFDHAEPVKSESAKSQADPITPAPSEKTPTTDAKAIASIVDSVLAELRPRIVEEIARKLGDPRKD